MIDDRIIAKVSEELGLPKGFVSKVYKAYWRAVKEHIEALPLKEDLTDEEFLKLQPNVNIPSIGKLNVTLDRYKALQKSYKEYLNQKQDKDVTYNKDKASV